MIQDNEIVKISDLGANYFLREVHVGKKTRAEACLKDLRELNPYVKVSVRSEPISAKFLDEFDVVIFTDIYEKARLIEINEFLRGKNKGFIYGGSLGLYGFTFVDFGDNFKVFDKNGENTKSAIIVNITSEANGVVTVHEDKKHGFEDGDSVTFKEVQGMKEINGQTFEIKVLSPYSFSVGDTRKFSQYLREGIVEQVKVPIKVDFKSLKASLDAPYVNNKKELDNPDMMKFGRGEVLHLGLNGLLQFFSIHRRLPKLRDSVDAEIFCKLLHEYKGQIKDYNVGELDGKLLKNIAHLCRTQISPLTSFWGGVIAQEVVKFTGKFSPLNQWLHFDVCEIATENVELTQDDLNNRYADQIAVFGSALNSTIQKIR